MLGAACVAFLLVTASSPQAEPRGHECGLPDTRPLWLDYAEGSVSFRKAVFGRPGVIAATSGTAIAAELRRAGAHTVYWWNKLGQLVGTTTAPADSATIPDKASRLVDRAIASSGCERPHIILNELNGPGTTTPWTPSNAQYRANVLALLRGIAARGARPYLLLPGSPYTGGEALSWWRQAAEVADLVREVYFPAPRIMAKGPILGSRMMRQAFRQAIAELTAFGVDPARAGLVLGFQSGPGKGGREGLQPTSRWLRFVKLATLAAKQVAGELGLGTVISWGWGTFDSAGADPDKPKAACVYLWARDQALCDGPAAAGPDFNASLEEGQILLPPGVRCALGRDTIPQGAVSRVAALTGDPEVALSALFARVVESRQARIPPQQVLAAEQTLVSSRFRGSRAAYLSALKSRGAGLAVARGIIADQLRRAAIAASLPVPPPTDADVAAFYQSYAGRLLRRVRAVPPPSWLGGRGVGFALLPPGPGVLATLPTGRSASVATSEGVLVVTPLDPPLPLGAVPLPVARPAVRRALLAFARLQAYQAWTAVAQEKALARAVCLRDELPAVAAVDLVRYLPLVSLDG